MTMSTTTIIAIYFLIWWLTLFAVLPWGVRSQTESGDFTAGTDPGAPALHRVWIKLAVDDRDRQRHRRRSVFLLRARSHSV